MKLMMMRENALPLRYRYNGVEWLAASEEEEQVGRAGKQIVMGENTRGTRQNRGVNCRLSMADWCTVDAENRRSEQLQDHE